MFTTLFYQPILNLVIFIYNTLPVADIGLVILVFSVFIRLLLWPLNTKMLKSQKAMQQLQPKLDQLKKDYGDNKEEMSRRMMQLYKDEKVNPFAGCLPILVQIPVFFAIVRVFKDELSGKAITLLYPFIHNPGTINPTAFGFLDFSKPNVYLAIAAGLAQFLQAKLMPAVKPAVQGDGAKDESMAVIMNKQMTYIGPILTFMVCLSLPSGLAFYWLLFSLVSVIQQLLIFRRQS